MLNKTNKVCFALGLMALPLFAFADNLSRTGDLFISVKNIVTVTLIPLVFSLALLLFFYGVVKYIWSEGQGKEDGRKFMIWGVVALFVMSSVWGIVSFLQEEIWGNTGPIDMEVPTIAQ